MPTGDISNLKRLLVVKIGAFGDLFHALPAVHAIRQATDAGIDWVVQAEYQDLVGCFSDVDRVIPFPRHAFMRNMRRFVAQLRKERYDLVLDFQGLLKSALVARTARSDLVVGPSFHREGSHLFYHSVAGERDKNRHAVEECLEIASFIGADCRHIEFPLAFPEPRKVSGERPHIALAPGSRWETKNWPEDRFAAAGRELAERTGGTILVLGSSRETALCARVAEGINDRVVDLAGDTSLVEMGGLISNIDVLVTNDSGPMHMAAALGTPVVAIFGPTDPVRTGPRGAKTKVLCAKTECRPCLSRTCRRGDRLCLAEITAGEVVKAAMSFLEPKYFLDFSSRGGNIRPAD